MLYTIFLTRSFAIPIVPLLPSQQLKCKSHQDRDCCLIAYLTYGKHMD